MQYREILEGRFIRRLNRFEALVFIQGEIQRVHVKNTGRCAELLLPEVPVRLSVSDNPNRKTRCDLVAVEKANFGWINMDSQAPNQVVLEWLKTQDYDHIQPEYTYGQSRIDFYMEKGNQRTLLEIKGCTLEVEGIGFFPDAPTQRGAKHLRELAKACGEGYEAQVGFVIQMVGVSEVRPNRRMDPNFAAAWDEAYQAGVKFYFFLCEVGEDSLRIVERRCLQQASITES